MDDVPWLYVAMIFIAFVSWVVQRVREASEARRERIAERKAAERARRTTQAPEYESPYRSGRTAEPEPEPPRTFREVFQELERQMAGHEPEPEPTRVPPPLPPQPETTTAPPPRVPSVLPRVSAAPPRPRKRKPRSAARKRETANALGSVLRDRGSLRTALVLKEVLDRPRALRR